MSTSFGPRIYTNRFQVANQIVAYNNPFPMPGTTASAAIQARYINNTVYLIPSFFVAGIQCGYIHSYNLDTKTFSGYTQIPDSGVTYWLEIVGTDMYVASRSRSLNRPAYFKSTDGGVTWSSFIFLEAPTPVGVIRAMRFSSFNSQNGIVFGIEGSGTANAWYSTTTDGGATWSAWTKLATVRGIYDIKYLGNSTIIISGTNSSDTGVTWISTDGGITWGSNVVFSGTAICTSMSWLDSKVGYIAARTTQIITSGAGYLYITKDGGLTWSLLSILPSNVKSAINVHAFSSTLFVVNGYGSINTTGIMNVSRDGGLTWIQVSMNTAVSTPCMVRKDRSLFTGSSNKTLIELKIAG